MCEELGDYESALDWVSLYMDASWIQEDDENAKRTVAQFQEWGTADALQYRVMSGQHEALPEYVEYISLRTDEIFIANIIISANRYDWNVDHILERFSAYIPYRTNFTEFGQYDQQILLDQYARFLAELAIYYIHNKQNEGISLIMQIFTSSPTINSESIINKCVDLLEQHLINKLLKANSPDSLPNWQTTTYIINTMRGLVKNLRVT